MNKFCGPSKGGKKKAEMPKGMKPKSAKGGFSSPMAEFKGKPKPAKRPAGRKR